MIILAFVLSVIAAFSAGYKYERLLKTLKEIQESIKQKADAKKPEEEKSSFVDPFDPVLLAKIEHDRVMKTLNPDD